MKPVWVGFYSVKVTLVRWGQSSGIGSEHFRGCLGANCSVLNTHTHTHTHTFTHHSTGRNVASK
jgi:hypothetical protein